MPPILSHASDTLQESAGAELPAPATTCHSYEFRLVPSLASGRSSRRATARELARISAGTCSLGLGSGTIAANGGDQVVQGCEDRDGTPERALRVSELRARVTLGAHVIGVASSAGQMEHVDQVVAPPYIHVVCEPADDSSEISPTIGESANRRDNSRSLNVGKSGARVRRLYAAV